MKSLNLFIWGAGVWTQGLGHAEQILCHWAHEVSRFVTGWFNQTTEVPQVETESETYAILLLHRETYAILLSHIHPCETYAILLLHSETYAILLTHSETYAILLIHSETYAILLSHRETYAILLSQFTPVCAFTSTLNTAILARTHFKNHIAFCFLFHL